MREGVYLLILPGDDFGTAQMVKEIEGHAAMIVGVEGVRLLSNLPEGYKLIPMVIMTPKRIAALETLCDLADNLPEINIKAAFEREDSVIIVRAMLEEVQDER